MPGDTEDQFRGLPMADLIGGPLTAATTAQMRLAEASAAFIRRVAPEPERAVAPAPDSTAPSP